MDQPIVHPTAEVSPRASIGDGCRIWHQAQVREGTRLGKNCILGKGAYVDLNVLIGDNVKIENGCSIFHGAKVEDGVFLGPGVILTNDKLPRAINPDGSLKSATDWQTGKITVKRGASLGAGTIVLPGVVIGEFAMVGAGSVVTSDVPNYALVMGVPARLVGFVCACGQKLGEGKRIGNKMEAVCPKCGLKVIISMTQWEKAK